MARISGIDIPKEKRGVVALTYIYGIGSSRAKKILTSASVSEEKKVLDWSDEETAKIRAEVSKLTIEGELRAENQINIKRLMDIGCYMEMVKTLLVRIQEILVKIRKIHKIYFFT